MQGPWGRGEETSRDPSRIHLEVGVISEKGVLPIGSIRETGLGKCFPLSSGPLAGSKLKADPSPCRSERSEPRERPERSKSLSHRHLQWGRV